MHHIRLSARSVCRGPPGRCAFADWAGSAGWGTRARAALTRTTSARAPPLLGPETLAPCPGSGSIDSLRAFTMKAPQTQDSGSAWRVKARTSSTRRTLARRRPPRRARPRSPRWCGLGRGQLSHHESPLTAFWALVTLSWYHLVPPAHLHSNICATNICATAESDECPKCVC